jgi:hypothetical protein
VVFEKCAANRLHHEFLIFTSVHQRCRRFVPALLYRQLECPRLEKRETWGTPQLFLCQLSKSRTLYARKCRPPAGRACEPQASASRVSGGGIDDPKEEAETLRAGAWGELRCRRRDGPLLEKREKWGTPVSDWSELRDEPHNHRTLGEGGHPPGCGKRGLPRSLRPCRSL